MSRPDDASVGAAALARLGTPPRRRVDGALRERDRLGRGRRGGRPRGRRGVHRGAVWRLDGSRARRGGAPRRGRVPRVRRRRARVPPRLGSPRPPRRRRARRDRPDLGAAPRRSLLGAGRRERARPDRERARVQAPKENPRRRNRRRRRLRLHLRGLVGPASMPLGLAHRASHAFDLRWCLDADGLGHAPRGGSTVLGLLAIALGDGCVEAWAVPDPDASDVNGEQASSSEAKSSPRIVRPAPAFVGITTPAQGPTLALDWCGRADDGDRLAGATEGGCVVLWRVPRKGSGSGRERGAASSSTSVAPAFPRGTRSARPAAARGRFAPGSSRLLASGARDERARDRGRARPVRGVRARGVRRGAALTSLAWTSSGALVASSDDGRVRCATRSSRAGSRRCSAAARTGRRPRSATSITPRVREGARGGGVGGGRDAGEGRGGRTAPSRSSERGRGVPGRRRGRRRGAARSARRRRRDGGGARAGGGRAGGGEKGGSRRRRRSKDRARGGRLGGGPGARWRRDGIRAADERERVAASARRGAPSARGGGSAPLAGAARRRRAVRAVAFARRRGRRRGGEASAWAAWGDDAGFVRFQLLKTDRR